MKEETCSRVALCEDLQGKYRVATGTEKMEIRTELLRYISKGVYIDRQATGSDRTYRVDDIVEEDDAFYVVYSNRPTGERRRMPLVRAVRAVEGEKARYKLIFPDVA